MNSNYGDHVDEAFRVCHLLALRNNPDLVNKTNPEHCVNSLSEGGDQCLICMEILNPHMTWDHLLIHYKKYSAFT